MKNTALKLMIAWQLLATSSFINAETAEILVAPSAAKYELELITKEVAIPWGMVWLNESELLVTDRSGDLRLIRDGVLDDKPIKGVPKVHAQRQGGLLDIEIDPNYQENGWIYLSYSGYEDEGEGNNTSIMRARLKDHTLVEQQLLFHGYPNTSKSHHYGSRIEFDNEGYLYFSIGDRGQRDVHPQRLDHDAGKIHRIHPDGTVPESNPFVSQKDTRPTIYSYGHRNPQGMALNPLTGEIWAHEHGPRGGDEINIIKPAVNYGWPVITYGINYNGTTITNETEKDGMQQPEWVWTPSIAPSAMQFITSDKYPEWQGHLLVGSLKFAHVVLVELKDNKVAGHSKLFEGAGRIRSMTTHPNGELYIGIDGNGIFRVVSK
ncbi:MAG: PQQ-dependent sugar dehydrogenase [Aestuariibacter sp.]